MIEEVGTRSLGKVSKLLPRHQREGKGGKMP